MDCDGVADFVDTLKQMFSTEGEKANFKVDTYGETFDINYLNKIFLEKYN